VNFNPTRELGFTIELNPTTSRSLIRFIIAFPGKIKSFLVRFFDDITVKLSADQSKLKIA